MIKESSYFLTLPLIILTLFSIFSGYYLKDLMVLQTSLYNFNPSPFSDIITDQDFFNDIAKVLPTVFSLFGVYAVYKIYNDIYYTKYYRLYILLPYLSCKKFFFDAFNSLYIFLPSASFSLNITYKIIDQGFLEYMGPGTYNFLNLLFKNFTHIESTLIIYRSFLFIVFTLGALLIVLYGVNFLMLFIFLPTSFLFLMWPIFVPDDLFKF